LSQSTQTFRVSSAEVKLLILITHYFVIYALSIVLSVTGDDLFQESIKYLVCEMLGSDPNDPCHTTAILSHPLVTADIFFAVVFFGISPIMHLMFIVSLQKTKEKCMQLHIQHGMEHGTGGGTGIELNKSCKSTRMELGTGESS